MSFRRRTYPEVLENLLTTLTGGVASESQPFPPPGADHGAVHPGAAAAARLGRRLGLGGAGRRAARVPQGDRLPALRRRPHGRAAREGGRVPRPGLAPVRELRAGGGAAGADRPPDRQRAAHALRDDRARARADLRAARDRLPVRLRRHRDRRRARQRGRAARDRARARRPPGRRGRVHARGGRARRADDPRRHARRDRRRQGPVRDDRDRGDEPRAELDPRQRPRPRPERPAAGGQAHAAAGADRRHRLGHEPGADRRRDPGRDRRGAAHAGQELPPRERAGHARRARAGAPRRRHHRRHRRGNHPGHGHDHAARRVPAARPAAAADRLDRAGPPRRVSSCRSRRRSLRSRSISSCG